MNSILKKNNKKDSITIMVFAIVLILADSLMFWKTKYGYGGNDESFYLTIAHRLVKGDAMLADEWHMSQMSGIFIYPIMKFYLRLIPSTEGILLHFRWIFIGIKSLFAIAYFTLLKKRYGMWAIGAVTIYLLFTPFNILQMSYNSMGLSLLLLSGILMISLPQSGKRKNVGLIFSGIALAGAVLCCPYLLTLYVGIAIIKIYRSIHTKEKIYLYEILYFTIGCGIMAIIFLLFVFSRTSILDIINNVPEMLKDPEHPIQGVASSTVHLVESIFYFYPLITSVFILIAIVAAIDVVVSRKRENMKCLKFSKLYIGIMIIAIIVQLIQLAGNITFSYNLIMVPLSFLGMIVYYLAWLEGKIKKISKKPMILGSFGVVYGWLLNMSSNNQLNIFSSAMTIAVIASVLAYKEYVSLNCGHGNRYYKTAGSVVIGIQIIVLCVSVTHHVFWENDISKMDTRIEQGPMMGILTSSESAKMYEDLFDDLKWFDGKEEGNFVYFSEKPCAYLFVDMPYGTHSGWSGSFQTQCMLDERYYELHPDKIPKYIYLEKQYGTEHEVEKWAKTNGYQVNVLENGYALVES